VDISEATRSFERGLGARVPVLRGDLDLKHRLMTADIVLVSARELLPLGAAVAGRVRRTRPGARGLAQAHPSDLGKRKGAWLARAAEHMADAVERDWREWCKTAREA
jgi:hypothetical protein